MKADEFDEKLEHDEDVTAALDVAKAQRPDDLTFISLVRIVVAMDGFECGAEVVG